VYELTPYGFALKPLMRELALWGLVSLGPPPPDEPMAEGWLESALDVVFAPGAPLGSFEFRISGEVASIVDRQARAGSVDAPDVLVEGDVGGLYHLVIDGDWTGITVEGHRELLERMLDAVRGEPAPAALPA
jgi:hypothetical protein